MSRTPATQIGPSQIVCSLWAGAFALAMGLAVLSGAAQQSTILTNGRNLQIPINHGLPDKPLGFTFCRLRYQNIRRARKSGWGDDYPQADYNFMVRLAELTKTTNQPVEQWRPRLCERHRHGSRSLPVSVPAHAECGQLRLHARRDRPHARLPAEGRLSLDRRQLGSGLRVHPSESHANPARRKDRRPAGRAPDVLDSLPRQPAPADPVARLVAAYASGFRDRAFNRALLRCVRRPRQAGCARQHELGRFRQLGAGRRQPGLLRDLCGRRAMRWV